MNFFELYEKPLILDDQLDFNEYLFSDVRRIINIQIFQNLEFKNRLALFPPLGNTNDLLNDIKGNK